jgi:hypothetical protein
MHTLCSQEIFRVLKPGGGFAGYEWCSTDMYDSKNPEHQRVMAEIELGNGLPEVRSTEQVRKLCVIPGHKRDAGKPARWGGSASRQWTGFGT